MSELSGHRESARGQLFVITPPTIDGAVTIPAAAFDATLPLLAVRLNAAQASRITVRDLLIRRIGAGAAAVEVGVFVDTGDRYVTGGTLRAPVLPNVAPSVGSPANGITEAREVPTVTLTGSPARGTIQAIGGADLIDAETFVLDDGTNPALTFEFDLAAGGIAGDVAVEYEAGHSAAVVAAAIIAAINGAAPLNILAQLVTGETTLIELSNTVGGVVGNVAITETVVDAGFVVSGMTGGAASEARLIGTLSIQAVDRDEKLIGLVEKAILGSPGTLLVYANEVGAGTPDLNYLLDYVNRT